MVTSATYIPDYELELNGMPLPAELRVALMSLQLDSGMEGANRLKLSSPIRDCVFCPARRSSSMPGCGSRLAIAPPP